MNTEHIEFDKDRLLKALQSGLDLNNCSPEELEALKLQPDMNRFAEARRVELARSQDERDMAYNLTAAGAKRKIGPIELDCVLGNIVLLNVINSPLVSGDLGDEIGIEDIANALYVMARGRDVLDPVMQIAERIEDLYRLKDACKGNPELAKAVVDKVEEISKARITFAKDALEFYYRHFTGEQLQTVFDQIYGVISDAIKGAEELMPQGAGQEDSNEPGKKQEAEQAQTVS